jgi:hypothetical protein
LSNEQIPVSVEDETGECQMEGCRAMMAGQFLSGTNGIAIAVDQYNEFFGMHTFWSPYETP